MAEKMTYPRIPEKNWWTLRSEFQKTLPTLVTPAYLQSLLGLTSIGSAKNLVPPLRQLGLIDEEGRPTSRANAWRTDAKYDEVCAEMIKEVYPQELRDLYSGPDFDQEGCRTWFMHSAKLGKDAARQCVATYSLLNTPLARAMESGPKTSKTNESGNTAQQRRRVKAATSGGAPVTVAAETRSVHIVEGDEYPSLHIDLQIHISPEADAAHIDMIFASIAKYLYRKP